MGTRSRLVVAAAVAVCAGPALGIVNIYGWQATFAGSNFSSSLVEWRTPPSSGTEDIGDTSGFNLSYDPAYSPSWVLWGTDGGTVFTIDTETGSVGPAVTITSHIFGLNEFLTGLAFSPTGTMYSWSQNNNFTSGIYTINPSTGTAAIISPDFGQAVFGMTFSPTGALYASTGSSLLQLNPTNGSIIRTVGSFPTFITSIGWGPDGVLRGLEPHTSDPGTTMYTINPNTLQLTVLGVSSESLYGIAAIPAPGAALAMGVLSAGLVRRRRR